VLKGGGSYLSANDPRLTFGLGETAKVGRVSVYWASGRPQHYGGLAVDRYWRLTEGEEAPK
jgi:enediyne biosynthesis protein E4